MSSKSPPSTQVLAIAEAGETPAVFRGDHLSGLSSPRASTVVEQGQETFDTGRFQLCRELKLRSVSDDEIRQKIESDSNSKVSKEVELLWKKYYHALELTVIGTKLEDNCHEEAIIQADVETLKERVNTKFEHLLLHDFPRVLLQTHCGFCDKHWMQYLAAFQVLYEKERDLGIEKHELLSQKHEHECAIADVDLEMAYWEDKTKEEKQELINPLPETSRMKQHYCKVDDDTFQDRKNTKRAHEDDAEIEQATAAKRARCN